MSLRSGTAHVAAVARGERSVTSVVADALERVAAREAALRAFACLDEDGARARATALDEGGTARCAGLVVGVKDLVDTADLPTAYGSSQFAGHRPAADAPVVTRLRVAGAVILGKTETTEFALFHPSRTRNPADLSRTPGGSSSGSAAAVADGMVHAAIGTQTAASVVRPASFCGVYGLKPARGWTPTNGIWRLAESLDTVGVFARDVADLRLLYGILADPPPVSSVPPVPSGQRSPGGPVTVAVLDTSAWAETAPEVGDALASAADRLRAAGIAVRPLPMPEQWRELPSAQTTVMAVEVARNLHAALGDRVAEIAVETGRVVEAGDRCTDEDYQRALGIREPALDAVERIASRVSVLLAPSALGVAPAGLGSTGDPVMGRAWTLLGLPAANVPAYTTPEGLPVGVQVLGLTRSDPAFLDQLAVVDAALTQFG